MAQVIPAVIAAVSAAAETAAAAAGAASAAGAADAGLMAASAGTIAGETAAVAGAGVAETGMSAATLASLGATVASGAVGAYGAIQSGNAQANAAKYNSAVEGQNAAISAANAQIAEQSGAAQAGIQGQRTKAAVGQAIANEGASGVDIAGGSFTDVRSSMKELGQLDSMTIRSNAAREAYGYRNKAASEEGQSALSSFEAANDVKASRISAGSTFLGSMGTAGTEYQKYQLSSGNSL